MRVARLFIITGRPELIERVSVVADRCGIESGEFQGKGKIRFVTYELDDLDVRADDLKAALTAEEIPASIRRIAQYSNTDVASAELVVIQSARDWDLDSGAEYGTQYDWELGCLHCGTGAKQLGPLHVSGMMPKKAELCFAGINQFVTNNAKLIEVLSALGDACELQPVVTGTKAVATEWIHVLPRILMPPMASGATGIELDSMGQSSCLECCRDGYFDVSADPDVPIYRQRDLQNQFGSIPPIATTWECFGYSSRPDGKHKGFVSNGRLMCRPDIALKIKEVGPNLVDLIPITIVE